MTPMTSSDRKRDNQSQKDMGKPRFAGLSSMLGSGKYKLYLSLGSGSVLSFAGGCALLSLLEDAGLAGRVEEVWGNSSGAIVGGLWSAGMSAEELVQMMSRLKVSMIRDVAFSHIIRGIFRCPGSPNAIDGILKGDKLEQLVERCLPVKAFEQCKVPFRCIAYADDGSDRVHIFDSGPLAAAIRASISMQWVFLPKRIGGIVYLDGTMAEKTPVNSLMEYHLRGKDGRKPLILATYNGWDEGYHRLKRSHFGLLGRANQFKEVLQSRAFNAQVELAREQGAEVVVLSPGSYHVGTLALGRFQELYERALEVMGERLEGIE